MLLAPHPDLRVSHHVVGRERAPLLVIDNLLADPDRMLHKAASRSLEKMPTLFPGIRAPAPLSYQQFLQTMLNPLLRDAFALEPGRFVFPMCHFSLVTQAP